MTTQEEARAEIARIEERQRQLAAVLAPQGAAGATVVSAQGQAEPGVLELQNKLRAQGLTNEDIRMFTEGKSLAVAEATLKVASAEAQLRGLSLENALKDMTVRAAIISAIPEAYGKAAAGIAQSTTFAQATGLTNDQIAQLSNDQVIELAKAHGNPLAVDLAVGNAVKALSDAQLAGYNADAAGPARTNAMATQRARQALIKETAEANISAYTSSLVDQMKGGKSAYGQVQGAATNGISFGDIARLHM